MKLVLLIVSLALCGYPQTPPPEGAKALFFAAESGKQTPSKVTGLEQTGTQTNGGVTGLRYYIELQQPDHQVSRVNTSHIFHSGDRIELHLTSNVDGNLEIFQRQDNEPRERLFPSARLIDASGSIKHGIDTVIPAKHAWFGFDNQPGKILLTILLTALTPGDKSPENGQTLEARASEAHSLAQESDGSKALRIEIDSDPENVAEYKVIDPRVGSKLPPGVIATEIVLSHAR